MNGFDGVGGSNGAGGQTGVGSVAVGWSGATSATTYYLETNRSIVNEYKGEAGQSAELIIYRSGDVTQAGSVTLTISALTAGATGANLQDGLTSGMVVNFAAGQSLGEVFLVAHTDHAETGDQVCFTMTASTGGVLGGHISADLTIHDTDLVGDSLANTLKGGRGDEVISAGDGNDTIIATNGDDQIDGWLGIDTVDYSAVQKGRNGAGLTADANTSFYTGKGVGVDFVFNVDVIIGSAFNDVITGGSNGERYVMGAGNDTAAGNFGNDTLLGMSGEDRLTGGDLNNSVNGGAGQDLLNGGGGADVFVFDAGLIRANVDHIADFKPVDDMIQLARTGAGPFDALTLGALHNGAFHLGTSATKTSQHLLYDRSTGTLAYDADGKGGVAAEVFAILDHAPRIDASDFFIV